MSSFTIVPAAPSFVFYGTDAAYGTTFPLAIKNTGSKVIHLSIAYVPANVANTWSLTVVTYNTPINPGGSQTITPELFTSFGNAPKPRLFSPISVKQEFTVTVYFEESFDGPSESQNFFVTGTISAQFVFPWKKWPFPFKA